MQVMHRSPVLGQSLSITTPTASTITTTTVSSFSTIIYPSSTPTDQDSLLTAVPLCVKRGYKFHVASACVNCKKAHLACDVSRPCKRCVSLGKEDTCLDIKHKKRGRPKLTPKKPKIDDATTTTTSGINQTATDYGTSPTAADTLPSPQQIAFCHHSNEMFQKPRQRNNFWKSIQVTRLAPFSPTPSVIRTDGTLTITFEHDDVGNTSLSPSSSSTESKITMVLTMELCCARISDNITMPWGYYPQEVTHRSMYDFIAVQDTTRLSQLHRSLLDNAMETSSGMDSTQRHQAPPSTERTTSDLFHQKTINELSIMANGSHAFADALNMKTRSGTNELYNVCAYLGGGLGADIHHISTLSKLYIIMVCQKNNIVKKESYQQKQQQQQQQQQNALRKQPPSAYSFQQPRRQPYKTILPLLTSTPPSTTSNPRQSPTTTSSSSLNRYSTFRNIQPKPHDLRQVSLPAHFANNSSLNTISFGNNQPSPKINIAPSSPSSASSIPYTYFRSIISTPATMLVSPPSASSSTSTSTSSPSSSPSITTTEAIDMTKDESKTLAAIAYRHTPSTAGPRKVETIHHPTVQYFSQTSSSKATEDHSPGSSPESTPPRKQGMSIHSLLC